MARLILVLLIITLLSLGLAWVADEPGRVAIDWANYHLETSLLVVIAAAALFSLGCVIVYSLLFALIRSPRSWLRSRLAKRQTLGLQALTEAFAALATQDIVTARKQISRAQNYLPHQPLTLMFSAQIARAEGNESQARLYLEQMLKAEGTEFIALRGLIENAKRARDDEAALAYAEKALAVKPQNAWLVTTLAGLYAKAGRTQNALHVLEQSGRRGVLGRQELRRLSAYVLYENARSLADQKRFDFAIAVLEDIQRKQQGFAPASALLAQAYLKQNEMKRALKVLSNAWKAAPHPLLTQALLECYDADVERKKVAYVADKLAQMHREQRETHFLAAAMAMRRGDNAAAKRLLTHLAQEKETVRVCSLLAEIENAGDDREQAAHWLRQAAAATPDAAWTCGNCQHVSETWHLTCPQCGSVATLEWK